jgi:hypothetical protein
MGLYGVVKVMFKDLWHGLDPNIVAEVSKRVGLSKHDTIK